MKCIDSILNQTLKPDEILLVLDPIEDLIRFYEKRIPSEVKIVVSSGIGLSNARNAGIRSSRGEIVAFIDDDAWADRNWLKNMLKNYEDSDVWGVGGRIVPVFDVKRPKWLPEELDWIVGCTYKGMPESRAEIRNPIGANMSFRRAAFEVAGLFRSEVGRYGKKLLSGEEAEFAMRLKKLKPDVKIIYDPSAVVYHRVPKSRTMLRYALKRAFYEGYSKAILAKEYPLNVESGYLAFLMRALIKKILRLKFVEVFGIVSVVTFVGLGNLVGKIR